MRLALVGLVLILSVPAVVGSAAAAAATAAHPAPAAPLFAWVPPGGFPDRFPFGQCTWWAAYNRRVTWSGNAGDWLANAQAQGVETNATPSVGAIAVYHPGGDYSPYGARGPRGRRRSGGVHGERDERPGVGTGRHPRDWLAGSAGRRIHPAPARVAGMTRNRATVLCWLREVRHRDR